MENAIEVSGLAKRYPGFALEGLSFSLPSGCIMGLIGENGAGKSTTIRLLFSEEKDTLLEKYVVAKLSEAELRSLDPAKVAGLRRSAFGVEALVERSAARGLVCDPAGIEDIMLYYLRGETK